MSQGQQFRKKGLSSLLRSQCSTDTYFIDLLRTKDKVDRTRLDLEPERKDERSAVKHFAWRVNGFA